MYPSDHLTLEAEDLGYTFLPSTEPDVVGHPELRIVIRPVPTEQHFDPEVVTCTVAAHSGGTAALRLHHPWILDTHYRVCAGHITLIDRKDKHVVAFTFGGTLHIDSTTPRTVCRFTSPVPILEHSRQRDTLEVLLGEEVEVLFAERRAAARREHDGFDLRLAEADPFRLYLACLAALRDKIDRWPEWEEPLHDEFKHFLHAALHPRSGAAPIEIPSLVQVL